jgi:hypothetical protein
MPSLPRRRFVYRKRYKKETAKKRQTYRFAQSQWPDTLKAEFAQYEEWRTCDFNLDRPYRLQQRKSTFRKSTIEFECLFGYMVNIHEKDPATLQLADVADPELLIGYVKWHAQTRNGPCRFIQKSVMLFYTVARYYLRVSVDQWTKLQELKAAIRPSPTKTRNKRERWNSLDELEAIGKAEYPSKTDQRRARTPRQKMALATQVQRSLIIRLLVRRPLRNRNVREMKLGENLYYDKKQGWIIEFTGEQMKIGERKGRENVYQIPFPDDLIPLLEEWLDKWRPILNVKDLPNVFISKNGKLFSATTLNSEFKKTVYEYTGKATNFHLIRDIWATEYIETTRDIVGAAQVLGDEIETVLRRYTHLLSENAGKLADEFLRKALKQSRKQGKSRVR